MSTLVQPAYPYINVTIDTSALVPAAQRNPGVVAVVGNAASAAAAPAETPFEVTDHATVMDNFAAGTTANALTAALDLVLAQDPRPNKIYGVRTATDDDYAAALASLDAADDVTFVCLAGETTVGNAASGGTAATGLMALKEHVENASASGNKRIAVAMVDPATPRSTSYVSDVLTAAGPLRSGSGRMVLVAARGATLDPTSTTATADAAAAVMGVIAGYPPGTSMVLKQVRGFTMPVTSQYTPAEITGLAGEGAIPLVDPALIPGSGLYLGDGGLFSSDAARNYVDLVTLLDQLEFVLRAGLIGTVGDTAITKPGLTSIRLRIEGIVAPFVASGALDSFDVTIPLLRILSVPAAARDAADAARLVTARQTRQVDAVLQAEVSGRVHQIDLIIKPHF